jgi:hypothetical protein
VFVRTRDKAGGDFRILHRKELRDLYRPSWEIKGGEEKRKKGMHMRNTITMYKIK